VTAIVPPVRPIIGLGDIRTAAAVRSITFEDLALLTNHILGRGGQIVPAHLGTTTALTVAGGEHRYTWQFRPRIQTTQRYAFITMRAVSPGGACSVDFPQGGTPVQVPVSSERSTVVSVRFDDALSSQSEATQAIVLGLTPKVQNIVVESITIGECPRASLVADATDLGTNHFLSRAGQPITHSKFANIETVAADESKIGRRSSLLQWAVPYWESGAVSTNYAFQTAVISPSTATVWEAGGIPIHCRIIARGAQVGTVTCQIYVWVDTGATWAAVMSSALGFSNVVTGVNTSPAWSPVMTNTVVVAEDLTTADGRLAATWETIQMNVAVIPSEEGDTAYVAAVSMWET
jgi:hypothetical protein